MSTFITRLENLSEKELLTISQLEKGESLYILSDANGQIPVQLFPLMTGIKCKNEIVVSNAENPSEVTAFMLGMLCAEAGGNIYLVLDERDPLIALNRNEYSNSKGKFMIRACSSFEEAFKMSKNSSSNKPKTTRTRKPKAEIPVAKVVEDENDTEQDMDISSSSEEQSKPSEAFVEYLRKIETADIPLVSRVADIHECILHAYDGVLTFKFQIELRCGKENADAIYELLEKHYAELRKLA